MYYLSDIGPEKGLYMGETGGVDMDVNVGAMVEVKSGGAIDPRGQVLELEILEDMILEQ